MKKLLLCLFLAGCNNQGCETLKAHAEEVGIATGGGATAVFIGGPIGLAVAIAGMSVAAIVGEANRPPPVEKTTNTTTVLDKDGKIIDQKTTTTTSKEGSVPNIGFLHSITSWFDSLLKIGIALAVAVWLLTHPWAIEKLVGVGASGVQLVKNASKTIQKALHPIATKPPKITTIAGDPREEPPA